MPSKSLCRKKTSDKLRDGLPVPSRHLHEITNQHSIQRKLDLSEYVSHNRAEHRPSVLLDFSYICGQMFLVRNLCGCKIVAFEESFFDLNLNCFRVFLDLF